MYSTIGRPSIPPERLLKAQLLIALYSVRSERQFCERLDYDLLFRFFLDMNLDDASWDPSVGLRQLIVDAIGAGEWLRLPRQHFAPRYRQLHECPELRHERRTYPAKDL